MKPTRTSSRKQQHVEITLSKDVSFRGKTTGFERWEFLHNAVPELDLSEVDPSTTFLGKKLSFPLIISSMTGGYHDAIRINRQLAGVCARKGLAMGVGSQRQALENSKHHRSFSVVREVAPDIPVFGNIGAAEVAKLKDVSGVKKLAELIRADAFAVHLNPLQEFLQPEGNPQFRGVLDGIARLVRELGLPIIVKEIGAGISMSVAGGTSWAGVEILRRGNIRKQRKYGKGGQTPSATAFWDWGIPTVDALRQVSSLKTESPSLTLISSGGISGGLDIAKSIAFGADLAAAARTFLRILESSGANGLMQELERWEMELRGAMFLTGSRTIPELQEQQLVLKA